MTDLEITKLCAEAMGLRLHDGNYIFDSGHLLGGRDVYDPLHDDAQAMALVKNWGLEIMPPIARANRDWRASIGEDGLCSSAHNLDLNRAICECVAKMQAAK